MTTWNFRIMKRALPSAPGTSPEIVYEVHEVYYNDDGTTANWTESGLLASEDLPGIQWHLDRIKEALAKPVIDFNTGQEIDSTKES